MFFHKTSRRQNEKGSVREKERMNKEKGTRKSYFQNDSQEANKNPHI